MTTEMWWCFSSNSVSKSRFEQFCMSYYNFEKETTNDEKSCKTISYISIKFKILAR